MLTAKQIAANRLNSQEAPGSRTVEGKAVSSFNALKHGAGHHARYSPVDPKKCFLLEASIELCLRRMRCLQAILWEHATDTYLAEHPQSEGLQFRPRLPHQFRRLPAPSNALSTPHSAAGASARQARCSAASPATPTHVLSFVPPVLQTPSLDPARSSLRGLSVSASPRRRTSLAEPNPNNPNPPPHPQLRSTD
jgi:hypothetical protein